MTSRYDAVLFDLDGTLVDTAPDLGAALNAMLQSRDRAALDPGVIRPWVSKGSAALIELGFGTNPEHQGFDELRREFLDFYGRNLCVHSRLFDGIGNLLSELANRDITWGVVTNKPKAYTDPLITQLKLPQSPGSVISGDSLQWKKPHPAPLLQACRELQVKPEKAIYIGDDERDVTAARHARMQVIAVGYGYTPPGQDPESWGADYFAARPGDLMELLV